MPSPGLGICGNLLPVPGFLNADVEGASLIGVPTGGVCDRVTAVLRASEDSGVGNPRVGDEASAIEMSGEDISALVEAPNGPRARGVPRRASACAGSYERHRYQKTFSLEGRI